MKRLSPPRSAYVHVPFCARRCGYCNFTLVAGRGDLVERYLQAIELELAQLGGPREVDTLFFGGGTPTFLSPDQMRRLAQAVLKRHPLAKPSPCPLPKGEGSEGEWTVEANPNDVDRPMIESLAELGVNRLSLGAQSFRADKLQLLERDHEAGDVERAVRLARGAGMAVALDLIFATPGETLTQWAADLDAALALALDHISTYGLTFERGARFWSQLAHGQLVEVDEETQRDMYLLAIDRLASAGLAQYEISNFARPGCRSRHNEAYWLGEGYYGYGPGAARYVDGVREINHRSTTTYLKRVLSGASPVAEREKLDPERRARELLVFGLRRTDGIQRQAFADQTGFDVDELVGGPLKKFVDLGLLVDTDGRIRLTREGLVVSDAIWPEFL
jgi:oxygen-independent coproporphyrinogen-3 oxidase